MGISEQDLTERYQSLETEELVSLYKSGDLTELARSVMTRILAERGEKVEVPESSQPSESTHESRHLYARLEEFSLDVQNHDGSPQKPESVFFGNIEGLGTLFSATSNLVKRANGSENSSKRVGRPFVRSVFRPAFFIFLIVSGTIGFCQVFVDNEYAMTIIALVLGVSILAVLLLRKARLAGPEDICSFVGSKGILYIRRSNDGDVRSKSLLFDQATNLKASSTKHTVEGVSYVETTFSMEWVDSDGRVIQNLATSFNEKKPKSLHYLDEIHFLRAAQNAWNQHRLSSSLEKFKAGQPERFLVGNEGWIDVGPDYVVWEISGQKQGTITAEQVEWARLKDYMLQIKLKEMRLLQYPLAISLPMIDDSQYFLFLLDHALQIQSYE